MLYGQRRVGKTSILQFLEARLDSKGTYFPVFFDLQDRASEPLGDVIQKLARTISRKLKCSKPSLGETPEETFKETWLPAVLDRLPDQGTLILLLDEFDVLADAPVDEPVFSEEMPGFSDQSSAGRRHAGLMLFPFLKELQERHQDRLSFVYTIGRNVKDLDTAFLSLFKGLDQLKVSLLSPSDTKELIHLGEGTVLHWTESAIKRVFELTCGHAYLTQQLCSTIWDSTIAAGIRLPHSVVPGDVDDAVEMTLRLSENALVWLWDGLGPAERIVASTLAAAGPTTITEDQLETLLHDSGVRVFIRELERAPKLLTEWDLLEPNEGGHCFHVELLRRWIVKHRSLERVAAELDQLIPAADGLFQAAKAHAIRGQTDTEQRNKAIQLLKDALDYNPNHVGATDLLARLEISADRLEEARRLLEHFHSYQPALARSLLTYCLLKLIDKELAGGALESAARVIEKNRAPSQLEVLLERLLGLAPEHPEGLRHRNALYRMRGAVARQDGKLELAEVWYDRGGDHDAAHQIHRELEERAFLSELARLEKLKRGGSIADVLHQTTVLAAEYPKHAGQIKDSIAGWLLKRVEWLGEEKSFLEALELAREGARDFPDHCPWGELIERLEVKQELAGWYQQALGAGASGREEEAARLLLKVLNEDLYHADAAQRLAEIIHRVKASAEQEGDEGVLSGGGQGSDSSKGNQAAVVGDQPPVIRRSSMEAFGPASGVALSTPTGPVTGAEPVADANQMRPSTAALEESTLPGELAHATVAARSNMGTRRSLMALLLVALVIFVGERWLMTGSEHLSSPQRAGAGMASGTPTDVGRPVDQDPDTSPAAPPRITWIQIRAGEFMMGSNDGYDDEKPVHKVSLSPFKMSKTEVTVAQYRACVKAGACTEPKNETLFGTCNWDQEGREDHPINCVDWSQARAFANWVGGRLPTEAEWEFAARGTGKALGEERTYPWGEKKATCARAVMNDGSGNGCGVGNDKGPTWPVCAKKVGNTPEGLCDMAGNVWEWVADWYGTYESTAQEDPSGPKSGSSRVIRGGSWGDSAVHLRGASRYGDRSGGRDGGVGFRVVAARPR